MQDKIKIIFLGDITGSLGREAVQEIIPKWKKEYQPDIILANVENLAHGKGVTEKTLRAIEKAGVEIFTGGNHIWDKEDLNNLARNTDFALACPANDYRTPKKFIYQEKEINGQKLVIINLMGRVYMDEDNIENPFFTIDKLLKKIPENSNIIIDLHAEASSEKRALGFYLDGKVATLIGTHTHIPTADAQILEKGTGYITDIGMTGPYNSVLGIEPEIIIKKFLTEEKIKHELPTTGKIEINAVLLEISNNKTESIKLLREIIN